MRQLTRKRIVAAAIELIERDGAESVSMRRLATALGCGVMSLYNYVPSRAALLDAVAAEVTSRLAISMPAGAGWEDQLRARARAFRQIAMAHPRCAMIIIGRPPATASEMRPLEHVLAALHAAGFGGPEAVRIMRAFVAFLRGSVLHEAAAVPAPAGPEDAAAAHWPYLRPDEFPQVTGLAAELSRRDPDADFEFGLGLLLAAIGALRPPARQPAGAGLPRLLPPLPGQAG